MRVMNDRQFWLDKISVGRVARAEGWAAGAGGGAGHEGKRGGPKGQEGWVAPLKVASWSTVV